MKEWHENDCHAFVVRKPWNRHADACLGASGFCRVLTILRQMSGCQLIVCELQVSKFVPVKRRKTLQ
jgi:hypothetical protein